MANLAAMSLRHPIAVIFLMIMAMAMVWSRALVSISAGFLAIIAVLDIQINPFRIRWMLTPSALVRTIKIKPFIWVFALYFLIYLLSIVYSGDVSEWWKMTHVKLYFLILPLAFAFLLPITRKEYMLIAGCMIVTAVWSSIWVQVAYYSQYDLFSRSLGFGGSLPTPIAHLRYSVVIAMSMVICIAFAIENWKIRFNWERWAYGIAAAYLFYFLHVLSVRSGLALAYAGIFILVIFYIHKISRWKQLGLVAIVCIAPIMAYKMLPGFKLKVDYTLYDLKKHQAGEGENYSDSERWKSWRAGLSVGNRHPFFGTGTGKFRSEVDEYYQTEFKQDIWMRPENQWINVFTILGLFGLLVFSFIIIYPMTLPLFWRPPLMPTLYILQLLSMLIEHPLDTIFGTLLFLMLTLMGLSYQDGLRTSGNDGQPIIKT